MLLAVFATAEYFTINRQRAADESGTNVIAALGLKWA
jgi:hypothetical protein